MGGVAPALKAGPPVRSDQGHRDRVEEQRGRQPAEAAGAPRDETHHHERREREMIARQNRAPLDEERDPLVHRHRPGVRQALGLPEEPALDLGGGGRRNEPASHDEVEADRRGDDRGGDRDSAERLPPPAGAERVEPDQQARLGASQRREPEPRGAEPGPIGRDGPGTGRHAERRQRHLHAREGAPHETTERDDGEAGAPGETRRESGRPREAARDEPRGRPAGKAQRLRGRQARHSDHEEARERHTPERRRRRRDRLAPVDAEPATRREIPREPEVDPAVVERQARSARDPAFRDEEDGDGQRAGGEKQDVPPVEARGRRPRGHAA